MIQSLSDADIDQSLDADVLVIGAGIAGLIVAVELARAGKRVVVIESGHERQDTETHPLNEVDQTGSHYSGALHGRARCLGGTSTLWGGAMLPILAADFEGECNAWPVDPKEFLHHVPYVERMFALPDDDYDRPDIGNVGDDAEFRPRLAKWPPFRERNVSNLFDADIRRNALLNVWLDATATHFAYRPDGALDTVTATSSNGRTLKLRAREVVIAAGAIESTRLLLLADRQANDRIFAPHDVLGRYFHDHLSVPVATLAPRSSRAFNRMFGFRFQGANMRNLRFEPSPRADVREAVVPGFAHVGFSEVEGGFVALRDLLRRLQQKRLPQATTIAALVSGSPWIMRAIWWRFVEKRLLAPAGAEMVLHTVVEQEPVRTNRISLSTAPDPLGMPKASIHWTVSAADEARLTRFTDRFIAFWESSPLAQMAYITRRPQGEAERELTLGGGIYHPCGSTRMGTSAVDGVVDGDLRCFHIPNLSVLATSTFPRAGGANPTMTLMTAAVRLSERLSAEVC